MRAIAATLFLATISSPLAFAEGGRTMIDVTAANGKSLAHHKLTVKFMKFTGKTIVILKFLPTGELPYTTSQCRIYDEEGENLVSFTPEIIQGERLGMFGKVAPGTLAVNFVVADKLVDSIEVTYHFEGEGAQPHTFKIKKGELRKLAALGK